MSAVTALAKALAFGGAVFVIGHLILSAPLWLYDTYRERKNQR